jgi:hypothetical protein
VPWSSLDGRVVPWRRKRSFRLFAYSPGSEKWAAIPTFSQKQLQKELTKTDSNTKLNVQQLLESLR